MISVDGSTNGATVGSDGISIYYTNANNVADAILYTLGDMRTNSPATYREDDTQLTASGKVVLLPVPTIGTATFQGSDFVFSGTGGISNSLFCVLASANLSLPVSQWQTVVTNAFDMNGNFYFTNSTSETPQRFYLLLLP